MMPGHGGAAEAFDRVSRDAREPRSVSAAGSHRGNASCAVPVTPAELRAAIRNIPDFPTTGIQFKDITPLLADARLLAGCVDLLAGELQPGEVDLVAGIDARGFLFATPLAIKLNAGVVPVRKKGKLPFQTIEQSYDLEYGMAELSMHVDAIRSGNRVLLVDDVLATGGTAAATISLIERLGGRLVETVFLMELGFLNGRSRLAGHRVRSLVKF
jgi:adenine phosphoribosyltransferase